MYCELTCLCTECDNLFNCGCRCINCDSSCWCVKNARECTEICGCSNMSAEKFLLPREDDHICIVGHHNNSKMDNVSYRNNSKMNNVNYRNNVGYHNNSKMDNVNYRNNVSYHNNVNHYGSNNYYQNIYHTNDTSSYEDNSKNQNTEKSGNCNTHHHRNNKTSTNTELTLSKSPIYQYSVPVCKNRAMQLNQEKKTIVCESKIAGYGLFAGEDIPKDSFVIEYVGELVSHAEAERRGCFYDIKKCSYLFDLCNESERKTLAIDAANMGNGSRFINHSVRKANLRAKVMQVNGRKKIGFYATKDIKTGQEMFFDYKYDEIFKEKHRIID